MTDTYNQVYDHELNAVKGAFGQTTALEKTLDLTDDGTDFVKGRACSISQSTRKWVLGVPDNFIPWLIWDGNGIGQTDVRKVPGGVGGNRFVALCCLGGYEVWTTEFLGAGFTPNTPLVSEQASAGNIGKIKITGINTVQAILGYCTCGDNGEALPRVNEYNKSTVQFVTAFHPVR